MNCPKCKTQYLRATKLEEGLPVMGCVKCEGAFLSLLYYRDWIERVDFQQSMDAPAEVSLQSDTQAALHCPKCSRIMTKYSVSGKLSTRLDLCGHCDEAWLDGGEWTLLKSLELANRLPIVFTEQWQRRIRSERTEIDRVERLKNTLGEEAAEKTITIKQWLKNNPHKLTILHFLGTD